MEKGFRSNKLTWDGYKVQVGEVGVRESSFHQLRERRGDEVGCGHYNTAYLVGVDLLPYKQDPLLVEDCIEEEHHLLPQLVYQLDHRILRKEKKRSKNSFEQAGFHEITSPTSSL